MPAGLAREFRIPFGQQKKIAKRRKVAESFVSAIVNGRTQPQTERTQKKAALVMADIAALFNVPVEVAFPETPPSAAPEGGGTAPAFRAVQNVA